MHKTLAISGLGLTLALAGCAAPPDPTGASGADRAPIVGGKADTMSRSIFLVALRNGGLCSGTLILPNLVLTAHHCVAGLSGMGELVQCGVTKFNAPYPASDFAVSWDDSIVDGVPEASVYDVTAVRVPTGNDVCGNDVALLELASNVPASQAVPLAPRLDSEAKTNEEFNAVGYGITNPNDMAGNTAGTRMRFDGASVLCVGADDCSDFEAASTEWVGMSPVCSGDSGGPALDQSNRIIGVVSRGPEQCNLAIYAAVYPWRSLIVDAAVDAATDGGYEPPSWVTGMPTDGGVPMPDGGTPVTDGGTLDGGGMDAGPTDAGLGDAGPRDGGSLDAGGPTDAGTMEAGTTDAGATLDGGPSGMDAGVRPDGGTAPDAGAPALDSGAPTPDAATPAPGAPDAAAPDGGHAVHSGGGDDASSTPPPAGCGCRTADAAGAANLGSAAWAFALALAACVRRRKSLERALASRRRTASRCVTEPASWPPRGCGFLRRLAC